MEIEKVRERLESSSAAVALTGAGVSAESGVPTFRGPGGLWRNFRAEELATPEAFDADPALVWEWYDWRRRLVASCSPNPAHRALAEIEKKLPGFTLITQNVDGLHAVAGARRVIELHGSIWRVRCMACKEESGNRDVPISIPPRCACGGLLRPAVVWFGEGLDGAVMDAAFEASSRADLMLVAGTSGVVQPAASLVSVAARAGAFVVEVNTVSTSLSTSADACLTGPAGVVLPLLADF